MEKYMPNPLYITSVRDPTSRYMSAYYHLEVGRGTVDPTDVAHKVAYSLNCTGDEELEYVQQFSGQSPAGAFAAYDFVLVTERFDESLLALRRVLLDAGLSVTMEDLLYLKSKESGELATDEQDKFVMPEHPEISEEPESVQDILKSKLTDCPDAELLRISNEALDKFQIPLEELEAFQRKLDIVADRCGAYMGRDCIWNDNGCGQSCIDGLSEHMALIAPRI